MLKNYLKTAIKVLLRRKVFTAISLFGISLTLGVLLIGTALLDHTFGPMPPEVHVDRTLGIFGVQMTGPRSGRSSFAGYKLLNDYVKTLREPEAVSIFSMILPVQSFQTGQRTELFIKRTDGVFWDILDFNFLEGGPFTEQDNANGSRIAVINVSTKERFFGARSAIGEYLEADGDRYRIVGVVEDVPMMRLVPFSEIWVPINTFRTDVFRDDITGGFMAAILAKDKADLPLIKDELRARLPDVELPEGFDHLDTRAETLIAFVSRTLFGPEEEGQPARLIMLFMILTVLFMVLPAVNLINLNLSRIMERSSEIGMRKAFGASSWTLVGQFVVENLVITLLGAIVGLVLAYGVLAGITASGIIPYAAFTINLRMFGYGLALAVFFGVFSGVYPAWRMSRLHPAEALRQSVL